MMRELKSLRLCYIVSLKTNYQNKKTNYSYFSLTCQEFNYAKLANKFIQVFKTILKTKNSLQISKYVMPNTKPNIFGFEFVAYDNVNSVQPNSDFVSEYTLTN